MSETKPNRSRLAALVLLAAPLAIYILLYLMPIGSIVSLSVDNGATSRGLQSLSQSGADPDARAAAVLQDMQRLSGRENAEIARTLNAQVIGFRSVWLETSRAADDIAPNLAGLVAFNPRWAEPALWQVLESSAAPYTTQHFEQALGVTWDEGGLRQSGDDVYLQVMLRTLAIAAQVTIVTLIVGYPLAYAVANAPPRVSRLVLVAILLSFWTSILVRTTAWVILLQTTGLVNQSLLWLGVIAEPLQLIFNRFGAIISMTHVLLPFAIIPMMNVMRTIPKSQSDASRILGAGPIETFLRVYFPQTLRGVAVAGGTVFILTLGFYITPSLTGGPSDQMISFYIADFVKRALNWGMASALSVLLLSLVLLLAAGFGLLKLMITARSRQKGGQA